MFVDATVQSVHGRNGFRLHLDFHRLSGFRRHLGFHHLNGPTCRNQSSARCRYPNDLKMLGCENYFGPMKNSVRKVLPPDFPSMADSDSESKECESQARGSWSQS